MHWITIQDFPNYSVGADGEVRNDTTGHVLTPSYNQQGIAFVSLTHDGARYSRSVARLVIEAHWGKDERGPYDTPIHVNGDHRDCRAANLQWRPRWLAVMYHKQFKDGVLMVDDIHHPIVDENENIYTGTHDFILQHGVTHKDLLYALQTGREVYPIRTHAFWLE